MRHAAVLGIAGVYRLWLRGWLWVARASGRSPTPQVGTATLDHVRSDRKWSEMTRHGVGMRIALAGFGVDGLGLFPVARDQGYYDALTGYISRVWRIRSVDEPAALMAAAGHHAVYAYRFEIGSNAATQRGRLARCT